VDAEPQQPAARGATADLLAEMFASTRAGLAILRGRELVIEVANEAFEALAPGAPMVGRPAAAVFRGLSETIEPTLHRVLETGEPAAVRDLAVRPAGRDGDGRGRYVSVCVRRLEQHDGDARLWLAVMDTTSQVRARRRTELLASFSTGLNSHPKMSVVMHRALRRAVALLGGSYGALWLLDPDDYTLRAAYGTPLPEARHRTFDLRMLPTCRRALQAHAAVFVTRQELASPEAELFERLGVSAGLLAPLVASAHDLGLLTISFQDGDHQVDDDDLLFATGLGAQSALAIERSRALEEVRRADAAVEASRARLRLLADVSRVLSAAPDWDGVVHATTRLAAGRLADWAILDVVVAGDALRREAVRVATPSLVAPRWAPEQEPPGADASLREALEGKLARAWDLAAPDDGAPASPHLESLRAVGAASAILGPLVVRGEVLGVLTLARAAGVASYDREDVSLVQDLSLRVAVALHDARLARSVERADEARGDLLAMASHELRTPLTALKLELGQLSRVMSDDAPSASRVRVLERAADRLTHAVEQLLDIAHIAVGDLALDRRPLDLAALVAESVARLSPEIERMGCAVQIVAPTRLPVFGDRLRLRGLIRHLIDQAARLGSGRPLELVLSSRHGRSALELRYRGEPIPPEIRDSLAAPLERYAPRLSLADLELGLWIARWIAEAHGGRLLVRPASDGAVFVAELPADGPTSS
jgi:K+-sensing histidine kinase KdpD